MPLSDTLSRLSWCHNVTGKGDPLAQIANGPGYILVVARELSETGYMAGKWGWLLQWAVTTRPVPDIDVLYADSGKVTSRETARTREAAKSAAWQQWIDELKRIDGNVALWADKVTELVDSGLSSDALRDAVDEWWEVKQKND